MRLIFALGFFAVGALASPVQYDDYGCVVDGTEAQPVEIKAPTTKPPVVTEDWGCEEDVPEAQPVDPCLLDPCKAGCPQPCDQCSHLNLAKCAVDDGCEEEGVAEQQPYFG